MLDTDRMRLISEARYNKIWLVVRSGIERLPTGVVVTIRGADELYESSLQSMNDAIYKTRGALDAGHA